MKSALVAQLINEVRDAALTYRDTAQLRARIQDILLPVLHEAEHPGPVIGWAHDMPGRIDLMHDEIKQLLLTAKPVSVLHYTIPLYRAPVVLTGLAHYFYATNVKE